MEKSTVTIDGIPKTFHEAHQGLWNELSQNPGMTKKLYFATHNLSRWPAKSCFACESALDESWVRNCEKCPIVEWRNDYDGRTGPCVRTRTHRYNLFGQWSDLMDNGYYAEACEIAADIANLEWKEVEE